MTATIAPPAPPPPSPPAPAPVRRAGEDMWQRTLPIPTIALTLVTVATAVGMIRLFADWSFLRPMVAVVVGVHAWCFVLRLARIPGWIAVPLGIVGAASAVGIAYHPGTTWLGVPTPALLDALRLDLRLVFDQFPSAVAPVPSVGVFAASAALLLALCAAVADTFAFRAYGRIEAVVPAGLAFVFTSALAAEQYRITVAVVWLAAAVVCVASLRAAHDHDDVAWLGTPRRDVLGATLAAVAVAVVVAAVAAVVAPRLPGAGDEPLIETRNRISGETQAASPLVDIRSRLVNLRPTTMITVEASFPTYWRSVGLSSFDGQQWRVTKQDLRPASELSGTSTASTRFNTQRITVGGLRSQFLPVAAEPVAASGALQWAPEGGALLAGEEDFQRGDVFDVQSAVPSVTADQLRAAGTGGAPSGTTDLPDGVPEEAVRLAAEVTAGAPTAYDQARALQDWFQNNFEYDLNVQLGHSDDAIREFLQIRKGYCEQFAGTFAVMARSLGIPTRVATGFTPGREIEPGRFQVQGKNAHAWAEVWFDGIGWVLFEPTPQRGAPGAEGWTGLPPAQDDSLATGNGDTEAADGPSNIEQPTPTTVAGQGGAATTTVPAGGSVEAPPPGTPVAPLVIMSVIGALIAWFVAAPRLAAWRHRARDRTPVGRVDHAWRRVTAALERAGVSAAPGSTPAEFSRVVEREVGMAARSLRELAKLVTTATFSPAGVDEISARRSEVLAAELVTTAQGLRPGWARLLDRMLLR